MKKEKKQRPKQKFHPYQNLPFLWVLIINPNIDFIGTLQKSRFWRVKVRYKVGHLGNRAEVEKAAGEVAARPPDFASTQNPLIEEYSLNYSRIPNMI